MTIDKDRWRDRVQLEIGGRWQMLPDKDTTWRYWLFSPFCGLTRIGQEMPMVGVRARVPDGPSLCCLIDIVEDGIHPETKLRISHAVSRVFWLRFGCRVLGLDLGLGLYYRRRFTPTQPPSA